MGLFDLLRGVVPGAAQQIARYPWNASRNPAPSWLFDPASYDWSDVAGPTPLPDRLGAQELPRPMPLPDWPDPSFDDIHAQLVAGAASRIGPEHFALNPDNWTSPAPSSPGPSSMGGYDASPLSLLSEHLDPLQALSWPAVVPNSFGDRQDDVPDYLPPTAHQNLPEPGAPVVAASVAAPALSLLSGLSLVDLLPAGVALGLPLLAGLGAFLYSPSTASDDTCTNGRCGAYNREEDGAPPADSTESSTDRGGPDVGESSNPATAPQKDIVVSKGKYPEATGHIEDAIDSGHPDVLTIGRGGGAERGKDALRDVTRQPGLDRDEYPPKMFEEGGAGASVRPINPSDNRGAGACIGAQCRGLPDGAKVRIKIGE